MKTKLISLSAISAGFVAIMLTLGAYIELVDVFTVILASVFVMLPLYYNSYLTSFLTYLVGAVLAFLFSGFNFFSLVFPAFLGFFGVYPIVKCWFKQKKVNKILYYILSFIWCVGVIYGLYFFIIFLTQDPFQNLPKWILDNIYIFVGLVGAVVFVLYDRCVVVIKKLLDYNLRRILK